MESQGVLTEVEILNTVEKFEACAFRIDEFTHARHMTVACWYLATLPFEDALAHMRTGLQRFLQHHGKDGYHETITRFWMILLDHALRARPQERTLAARVEYVIGQYSDKNGLFHHYTRERVLSDEARMRWVEPDLHPIGFELRLAR